jgi:Arc/MetJ family transcription regulator
MQKDIDREALRIDVDVELAAVLTAIGSVRSTFFAVHSAQRRTVGNDMEKSSLSASP